MVLLRDRPIGGLTAAPGARDLALSHDTAVSELEPEAGGELETARGTARHHGFRRRLPGARSRAWSCPGHPDAHAAAAREPQAHVRTHRNAEDPMDRLDNTMRPYAWGSPTAIPDLLGTAPTGEPQAEMWMGAHPGAPSRIDRGAGAPLVEVIDADPERGTRRRRRRQFGPRLPFLLKILAAGAPLSLQVHPDLAQAKEGFADEERRGVPIDAAAPQLQGRQPQARADLRAHPVRRPVRLPPPARRPRTSSTASASTPSSRTSTSCAPTRRRPRCARSSPPY